MKEFSISAETNIANFQNWIIKAYHKEEAITKFKKAANIKTKINRIKIKEI